MKKEELTVIRANKNIFNDENKSALSNSYCRMPADS